MRLMTTVAKMATMATSWMSWVVGAFQIWGAKT